MPQAKFHRALYRWYGEHGRHELPWRKTEDAYKIWVSEVMLQQTQVKTVLERFYYPFLKHFPSITDLATADLQDVLQLWQGLGYYNRARNLHAAAQMLHQQGRNTLPSEVTKLMALSGIGKNTAHAIASFAFHQPVPVLEANVKRVVARIFALETASDKELWGKAFELLDTQKPFDYNQAMMDVGSLLCTPKAPDCASCPASNICQGKDALERYPQKAKKAKIPIRKANLFALENPQGRYAVRPRAGKFLHGLWEFPQSDAASLNYAHYHAKPKDKIGSLSHAYSHFKLEADAYKIAVTEKLEGWQWKTPEEIAELPLSRTEKKLLTLLAKQ